MRTSSLATVVLAGIVSLCSMPAMAATSSHKLRIYMNGSNIKSIYVQGANASGGGLSECVSFIKAPKKGWLDTKLGVFNGSRVTAWAHTNSFCSGNAVKTKSMVVPGRDGLTYAYLPLF